MTRRRIYRILAYSAIGVLLLIVGIAYFTPLHRAVQADNIFLVRSLTTCLPFLVDARDSHLRTPLHIASRGGRSVIAEILLARGADVNSRDEHGQTPLHDAAIGDHKQTVEILINRAADLNAREKRGARTPLFLAVSLGHNGIAELLMARGSDVNSTNASGTSTLSEAIVHTNWILAELLISNGASVSLQDTYGVAPLHLACMGKRGRYVSLLLAKGRIQMPQIALEGHLCTSLRLRMTIRILLNFSSHMGQQSTRALLMGTLHWLVLCKRNIPM
jgi:ankyrin repeat protein